MPSINRYNNQLRIEEKCRDKYMKTRCSPRKPTSYKIMNLGKVSVQATGNDKCATDILTGMG